MILKYIYIYIYIEREREREREILGTLINWIFAADNGREVGGFVNLKQT